MLLEEVLNELSSVMVGAFHGSWGHAGRCAPTWNIPQSGLTRLRLTQEAKDFKGRWAPQINQIQYVHAGIALFAVPEHVGAATASTEAASR